MSEAEHIYYQDQKTERRMEVGSYGVDPVWYHAHMRREKYGAETRGIQEAVRRTVQVQGYG